MNEFKKQTGELQSMIKEYFEMDLQANQFVVEGFLNQDNDVYSRYENILEKFETISQLCDKERKDSSAIQSTDLVKGEEYLKLENELLKQKTKKQEEKLRALKTRIAGIQQIYEGNITAQIKSPITPVPQSHQDSTKQQIPTFKIDPSTQ